MKKIVSMMLALAMCAALLAGCGNTETPAPAQQGTEAAAVQTEAASKDEADTQAAPAADATEDEDEDAAEEEDIVDIQVCYMNMGPVPQGVPAVEEAINEITEKEIFTHVHLSVYEIGAYDQQIGLMMASGEPIDLMVTLPGGPGSFTTMRAQGQFMDITDLLDEYGQGILEKVGDLVQATTLEGRVYAVPTYRNMASGVYIVMRSDVLEDLGLVEQARSMKSFSDYEAILDAVASSEKWSNLVPIVSGQAGLIAKEGGAQLGVDNFSDIKNYDFLGDNTRTVAVLPDDPENKVFLAYDGEDYKNMISLAQRWFAKNYLYKDALIETGAASEIIKSNIGFSYITDAETGAEASASAACDMPMVAVEMFRYPITTGAVVKFTWGVPSVAAEPEAAVKFLNMMYTDSRIANLLAWGIEGVDYEVRDGIACYIEGNEHPAYRLSDYLFGNQFLVLPWDGMDADIREVSEKMMKENPVSPYLGFMCDTEEISNEISAISTVLAEYRARIETGVEDESVRQEFVEKLNACGADKVVECYQKQLDAWLASK